jgi:hypothetical protein
MIAGFRDFLGGFDRRGAALCFDFLGFLNLRLFRAASEAEADSNDCQQANSEALHV